MTLFPILPSSSRLRALPYSLNDLQRIQFEAAAISSDIISIAYQNLIAIAARNFDFSKAPDSDYIIMFKECWTIVHETFLTTQMLKAILREGGGGDPIQQEFFRTASPAHLLRRKRDHLSTNVTNMSDRKGPHPPTYGTLSWFTPTGTRTGPFPHGRITAISAGSVMPHGTIKKFHTVVGTPDSPADGFALFGFGTTFHISRAINLLKKVINGLSEDVENDFDDIAPYEMDKISLEPIALYSKAVIFDLNIEIEDEGIYRHDLKLVFPDNIELRLEKKPIA